MVKALDVLFETVFPFLLAAALPAAPLLELPKPHSSGSGLKEGRNSCSREWLHSCDDGKHALRGTVVNSVTGEPIRGALVQIYFNGQSSMLTGPDGKFQFEGLPNGQTVEVCATTFGLEGAVGSDVTAHLPSVPCPMRALWNLAGTLPTVSLSQLYRVDLSSD